MQQIEEFDIGETIDRAASRLYSAVWVSAFVVVVASWGLVYAVSAVFVGAESVAVLLLCVVGFVLALLVLLDSLLRLLHCQSSLPQWPVWLMRMINLRSFRPLPAHLIDEAEWPVRCDYEPSLRSLLQKDGALYILARNFRSAEGHWSRAELVNAYLQARFRCRQLQVGLFAS